jgi:hypothetical protein
MDARTRVIQSRMQSKLLQINQTTNDIENVGGLIIDELKRQDHQMVNDIITVMQIPVIKFPHNILG